MKTNLIAFILLPFLLLFLTIGAKGISAAPIWPGTARTTVKNWGETTKQGSIKLLRLKMIADSVNYDDIVIGFSPSATAKFDGYEDSRDLGGMGAPEGLTAFSSDGVALAADLLPLPKAKPLTIQLGVTSNASRRYTMQRQQLDSIPKIYEIWLMDKFKKDSLDLRNNSSYVFDIDLADTASYGNNRFTIVIRQNSALGIHLLNFTAAKATNGSQIDWETENEETYTNFTVERSTDNGVTFGVAGGFISDSQGKYTLPDKNPVDNATNIYRLKIEDLNGVVSYSKTVSLIYGTGSNTTAGNTISVYPNPAVGTLNLSIKTKGPSNLISGVQSVGTSSKTSNQSYAIKIVNISGKVVKTATSPQATWQDDIATLLPGTYIVQVLNNSDKSLIGRTTFVKR
ncbi:MAG TPA: T9SS type A sorting domain-containing protein [Mucilaginibacter sp.]